MSHLQPSAATPAPKCYRRVDREPLMRAAPSRSRNVWLCSPSSSRRSARSRRSPPIASSRSAATGCCPPRVRFAQAVGRSAAGEGPSNKRQGSAVADFASVSRRAASGPVLRELAALHQPAQTGQSLPIGRFRSSVHGAYALAPGFTTPSLCPNPGIRRWSRPSLRSGCSSATRSIRKSASDRSSTFRVGGDDVLSAPTLPYSTQETRSARVLVGRGGPVDWRVVSERLWSCGCGVSRGGWRRQPWACSCCRLGRRRPAAAWVRRLGAAVSACTLMPWRLPAPFRA
jgi:hypothetical protein